jgi:hypothetical protein
VQGQREIPAAPQLWDGHAARRIIQILVEQETKSAGPLPSGAEVSRGDSHYPD